MKKNLLLIILSAYAFLNSFCFAQHNKIDSLLTLLKVDKPDTNKVKHLIDLSNEYLYIINNYEQAMHYGQEGKELAIKLNYSKGLGASYNTIGDINWYKGNYVLSTDNYFNAMQIFEKLYDEKNLAVCNRNVGWVYLDQNNYEKAIEYFNKSLAINKYLKSLEGIRADYSDLGNLYMKQNNYEKARVYYLKSLKISEEVESKVGIARAVANVGSTYWQQNDFPKALDYYFKALKLHREIGNNMGVAISLSHIGLIYTTTGKFKEAEQYLKKAIAIDDSSGALDRLRLDEEALSKLYDTTGKYNLALIHYKKAIALKDTIYSQENSKQLVRKEMNFEFDKKELAAKADQEKKDLITAAEEKKQWVIIKSAVLGLFFMILFAAYIFRSLRITSRQKQLIELQKNEVTKQKEEAEKQKDIAHSQRIIAEELRKISDNQKHIVEEKQKEIVDSITYARRIQTALLTSGDYIKKHLPAEHFILFKPKDIVSGDFYWALSIAPFPDWDIGTNKIELLKENERRHVFYLATADCTGHGVPGAFMSMLNISYLNENVIERGIRLPHDILNAQRKEIIQALNPEGSITESKDGMDCILCAYDFDKMLLHFASANNPLWLIREKSSKLKVQSSEASENNSELNTQNFELIEYKADKMPVGKYSEKMESFTLNTIELQKGDIIYTSTDGFADQFGSNGKKLMKKKFKEELLKIHQQPMAEQKEYLNQFFENWKENAEQVDDVCVIGVRI